ncbi:putative glycoprotein 3-alpha-L-fucosyltransferase [Helianthus annuus]|nr:putative glycoprotein 3-alpha-L-fucosyltransferase [Helianthus annuus]
MLLNLKPLNSFTIATMLGFSLLIFFCYILFNFPSATTSQIPIPKSQSQSQLQTPPQSDPFKNLLGAFKKWDLEVGCANFKQKHVGLVKRDVKLSSLQVGVGEDQCGELKMDHVGVLVKGWTWIPDNLDNLYSCRCGLSCLWTKSSVMVDKPDAVFFETTTPPFRVWFVSLCKSGILVDVWFDDMTFKVRWIRMVYSYAIYVVKGGKGAP